MVILIMNILESEFSWRDSIFARRYCLFYFNEVTCITSGSSNHDVGDNFWDMVAFGVNGSDVLAKLEGRYGVLRQMLVLIS